MKLRAGKRCGFVIKSEIRTMSVECEAVGGINLSQGVCDMPTPPAVRAGAIQAIRSSRNSYSRHDGVAELRKAIARKLKSFNGLSYDPETEIVVSGGSTGAFYSACLALLNPGDEVIVFEPYYGYHIQTLLAVEAVPVYVRMKPPRWDCDAAEVLRACTPRTKAILINTPANPTGKVFRREELQDLVAIARKKDLFIFTDEIYEHITYDGKEHISPAALPGAWERTITISGFSKTFSITGWRLGYAASDAKWARLIGFMSDLVYVCPPTPLQYGAAQGLTQLGESYYDGLRESLRKMRDELCSALRACGLTPYIPEGAYYVLADISRIPGRTGKERAMRLLERTKVACVPGEAFFSRPKDGYDLARFCYAKTSRELARACAALKNWNR